MLFEGTAGNGRMFLVALEVALKRAHWNATDSAPERCWWCTGTLLVVHWNAAGGAPKRCWRCIGTLPAVHWNAAGGALERCWRCTLINYSCIELPVGII